MRRHRHTSERAMRKLQEGACTLGEGINMTEVLRHLEIAESTWNRWRNQFGGTNTNGAKQSL